MTDNKSTVNNKKLSYKDAGVDIDRGDEFVEAVKLAAQKTINKNVLHGIGGFAALFELDLTDLKQPILCACTDGVGTKLKIAQLLSNHKTIGIDLVAMCANDLIVNGSKPLFFLDYYAMGQLDAKQSKEIIDGITHGCELAQMALIGGETAEMPGFYEGKSYDLAGFSVGVVDKSQIIDGKKVQAGDKLIGIQSSGLHSNGYSLIRQLISSEQIDVHSHYADHHLGELLLTPTKIYVQLIRSLLQTHTIHAMAHITGGGLLDNLVRVLPSYVCAKIQKGSWQKPLVYQWLDTYPQIDAVERLKTFNEGLGMVLCVPPEECAAILHAIALQGEQAWEIGRIEASAEQAAKVELCTALH